MLYFKLVAKLLTGMFQIIYVTLISIVRPKMLMMMMMMMKLPILPCAEKLES